MVEQNRKPINAFIPIAEQEDIFLEDVRVMSDAHWNMYVSRMKGFLNSPHFPHKAKYFIHNHLITMRGYRAFN